SAVLDRVQKLIALAADRLATNKDDHEGRTAAALAVQLIAQHKLRIVDESNARVPGPPPTGVRASYVSVDGDGMDIADFFAQVVRAAASAAATGRTRTARPSHTTNATGWQRGRVGNRTSCRDCHRVILPGFEECFFHREVGAICMRCAPGR